MGDENGSIVRQLASREVYSNQFLRLREDDVAFPNGTTGIYTVIEKRDFVLVIAEQDGGFWLVEQYRYPVGSREWEFPQGGWPAGRSGTVAELAAAELAEETGATAETLLHLGHLHTAYGFAAQGYDVFVARELTLGEPRRESTESDMVTRWFPEAEVREMIRDGRLRDAHTVAALGLYDLSRP